MDKGWSYSPAADGSDGDAYGYPAPWWQRARALLVAGLFFCVTVFAVVFIFTDHELLFTDAAAAVREPAVTSCGSTAAEARARGCRFELHNFAWTPPECYDEELNAAWEAQDWGYARDRAGTQLISRDEALSGEVEWAWVTMNQHLSHCVLIWQKLQRAAMLDRPADNWTTSYEHSYHCGHLLVQWDLPHYEYNSVLYRKFATCGYGWKTESPGMADVMRGPMDGGIVGDFGEHADTTGQVIHEGHEREHM